MAKRDLITIYNILEYMQIAIIKTDAANFVKTTTAPHKPQLSIAAQYIH